MYKFNERMKNTITPLYIRHHKFGWEYDNSSCKYN